MMTKKNFFEQIVSMNLSDEMTEFATHQLEMLSRPRPKSATPSKAQRENAEVREKIVALILAEDKSFTLADIAAELEKQEVTATPNKIAALLRPAIDSGKIVRHKGGKKEPTSYHRNENQL